MAQAARDLDLHGTVLRRWIHEFGDSPDGAFPGKGLMQPEAVEVQRLRREIVKLKAERDILKCAGSGMTCWQKALPAACTRSNA
ncbi:MAG: transposase [Rhizobiales bacterium]|nr:transposase [Hyphomicrobiales bacterium]